MEDGLFSSEQTSNRRDFLKAHLVGSLSALTATAGLAAGTANMNTSAEAASVPPQTLLKHYQTCLGGPFPSPVPLQPNLRETTQKDGYRIESITYQVGPGDRVPALILVPDHVTATRPAPGIAVWHQHNGEYHLGKSEPAGLAGNPMHHTAVALVREGYVVLCPDALCFEERQDPTGKLKGGDYERFAFLYQVVRGRSMAWQNVLEMHRAIDYLAGRPEVIPSRIGCYGHSMGSTHAWLAAPLDTRLKCVVGNCCLPTYEAIEEAHLLHCFPNFVPGWSQYGDTPDIAALIAPRALHLNFGEEDGGSPIDSVRRGLTRIEKVYQQAGASQNFTSFIEAGKGHVLSEAMWEHTKTVFARHLKAT
ncbi:dienelactone hydrolase family protein [Spirosoma fluviale]|uniref:Dienelactone hydrolase family protein n=1 Tax=Spirosoma fluviale TaxID=1597977 RepID=A0A286GPH0_9BACT|nr:dienelactone hydrolase family protein [Spirosoma fluviale]SOD97451.1 Dienelactone hydrolase family protein [Spirosoma fluviale]